MEPTFDEKQVSALLASPQTRRQAFEALVRQYSEQLYWQIRRIVLVHEDADDILQNVFIKAWNSLDSFRHDSKLSTWLYRIAVNESLDFRRKQKSRLRISADMDPTVSSRLAADRYFDGDRTQLLLQEAIERLPDVQRTVFSLRYFDEMKYSEMSQVLKTSEGALKASYHIAVKKIADFFKAHD